MQDSRSGSVASFACAALTIASMGVGIAIMQAMGVSSGMDVARASPAALRSAQPLLVAAELLKLATGAALIVAVRATARRWRTSPVTAAVGWIAGLLVIAAGLLGLVALSDLAVSSARTGLLVGLLGLLSLPATGIWAAMSAWGAGNRTSLALRILGLLLGVAGCVTLRFPPAGMLFGLTGLVWWMVLGLRLRRPA